jgi:hypothetical protein
LDANGRQLLSSHQIGLSKILTLEQQWFARGFGECIRKAVAVIQPSGMPTFPIISKGLPRKMRMFFCDRLDGDTGSPKECVELTAAAIFGLRLDSDGGLDKCCGRNAAGIRAGYCLGVNSRVGLIEQSTLIRTQFDQNAIIE